MITKKHKLLCNCWICKSKRGEYKGKNNPNYKHGKTMRINRCIDCKKILVSYKSCRCSGCENIRRFKGKTYKEMYGIIKANKLKRLRKLVFLGKSKSLEQKIKQSLIMKGKPSPFKGKHHTITSKKLLSLSLGGTGIPYENSEYGLEFNLILKEQIRHRDNNQCQLCGCTQTENGKRLEIHHIDYNKKNCKEDNLISLCVKCHRKTNINRQYWINYFNILINKEVCYV